NLPVEPVAAPAGMDPHVAAAVVAAEYAGEAVLKGYHRAVEDAVGAGDQVTGNDRVAGRAPDHLAAAGRLVLPGNMGQFGSDDGRSRAHGCTSRVCLMVQLRPVW